MVNNSTNINKVNNYFLPHLISLDIKRTTSRFWLGKGTKLWEGGVTRLMGWRSPFSANGNFIFSLDDAYALILTEKQPTPSL
jgi:hypothetical protein